MTNPIQPSIGEGPQHSPSSQQKDKVPDVTHKVAQATGGSPAKVIKKVDVGPANPPAPLPLAPDPEKAVGAVKQNLNLLTLVAMPSPIRIGILNGLTENELKDLEYALNKNITKPAFRDFHKEVKQILQNHIIEEILKRHPSWKDIIADWHDVSIEDKIWLLQVNDLYDFQGKQLVLSWEKINDLLKPEMKELVNYTLGKITEIDLSSKNLQRCPSFIGLLVNLETLDLSHNQLTSSPNLTKNNKLQIINISDNELITPPNVSKNVDLKKLYLNRNKLNSAPNVTQNINLTILDLTFNQITVPPNVTKNEKLNQLFLGYNRLKTHPNLSHNVILEELYIGNNLLTTSPDFSKNTYLRLLNLSNNQLTTLPNLRNNKRLERIFMENNPLTLEDQEAIKKIYKYGG